MIKLKYFYYFVIRTAFPKNCVQKTILILHAFFISNQHFYKQRQAEFGKSKAISKQHLVWTFGIWKLFAFFIHIIIQKTKTLRLQAFACCVVNVNDEHTKPRFKLKCRVKYQDGICAKLCLSLWFESDWYFCNITMV